MPGALRLDLWTWSNFCAINSGSGSSWQRAWVRECLVQEMWLDLSGRMDAQDNVFQKRSAAAICGSQTLIVCAFGTKGSLREQLQGPGLQLPSCGVLVSVLAWEQSLRVGSIPTGFALLLAQLAALLACLRFETQNGPGQACYAAAPLKHWSPTAKTELLRCSWATANADHTVAKPTYKQHGQQSASNRACNEAEDVQAFVLAVGPKQCFCKGLICLIQENEAMYDVKSHEQFTGTCLCAEPFNYMIFDRCSKTWALLCSSWKFWAPDLAG